MSIKIMTAVWEHSLQSGNSLLLLLALADFANDAGICWPSIATLADKARVSDRTIQRMIQRLIADKELEIVEKGGGRRSHRYRVLVRGDNLSPVEGVDNVTPISAVDTPAVTNNDTPAVTTVSPKPSYKPTKEPLKEKNYKNITTEWEGSVGLITSHKAEDLYSLADECEEHRLKLTPGSKGFDFPGEEWVIQAIKTARKSASGKFNVRYVQAIVDRWIRDGFDSPFARDKSADYKAGVGEGFWDE